MPIIFAYSQEMEKNSAIDAKMEMPKKVEEGSRKGKYDSFKWFWVAISCDNSLFGCVNGIFKGQNGSYVTWSWKGDKINLLSIDLRNFYKSSLRFIKFKNFACKVKREKLVASCPLKFFKKININSKIHLFRSFSIFIPYQKLHHNQFQSSRLSIKKIALEERKLLISFYHCLFIR